MPNDVKIALHIRCQTTEPHHEITEKYIEYSNFYWISGSPQALGYLIPNGSELAVTA